MRELYSHKVLTSFATWFDHTLLSSATAFQTVSTPLYYKRDHKLDPAYNPYASPFKQWVYDSSVPGAHVPTGVSGVGGTILNRASGVHFDFDEGRLRVPSGLGLNLPLSGTYSIKDFNIYTILGEDEQMVYEGNYQINSRYNMIPRSGISPYGYAAPACFIMRTTSHNEPFAFGGEQDTKSKMRVIVAADEGFNLDGCLSVFRDITESNIPLLNSVQSPFNEYGDLKSGVYNYNELANAAERLVFLEKVTSLTFKSNASLKINPNLKFGILDFYLSEPRFPKLDL